MRTVAAVLAVAATITAVLSTADAHGILPILRTIQDPAARFSIRVPVTWEVAMSSKDPVVEARSPVAAGQTPSTVDVIVRDMPAVLSPESCVRQAETVMRFLIPSFKTLNQSPKTVGGFPAYSHSYTWRTRDGEERRSLQVCVTLGHRAFVVIGTTDNTPDRVRHDMPTLAGIIDTLHPNPFTPEPGVLDSGGRNQ